MADFGDFIAHGVITQALVCEGDSTLEDLGIMSLEPGQVILKCKGAERLDDDKPFMIPGFTASWMYRDAMLEYAEWMDKATTLMRDMWPWVWESGIKADEFDAMAERLREFGIGDDDDD